MFKISRKKITGLAAKTDEINHLFNVENYPFKRDLTQDEQLKLRRMISFAYNEDLYPAVIQDISNYCKHVENNITGRAAGNIEDLVLRYFFIYFANSKIKVTDHPVYHMEIGVLFGATTIISHHAIKLAKGNQKIIVIDPFKGFYGEEIDAISKQRVDLDTFIRNRSIFGISSQELIIKQGFSTDEDVISACRNYQLASLIIDGDHSYDGVKRDWENYSGLICPGGYVLFDDYNSPAWPEVSHYVNREIIGNMGDDWEIVLIYGSSLIIRRTTGQ